MDCSHCTAVKEGLDGNRILEIADPWKTEDAAGKGSAGMLSTEGVSENADAPNGRPAAIARTHLLTWEFVCANFYAIYANWTPKVFDYRRDVHRSVEEQ